MEQLKQIILDYFKDSGVRPLSVHELEEELQLTSAEQFKTLVQSLNELEENGELVRTRRNRFGLPEKMNLIRGKIEMNKKGFAFLIPEDEHQGDIYIHANDLASAMNGDTVLVRLDKEGVFEHRPEGTVIRIVKRANRQLVGTYEDSGSFGFLVPDEKRLVNDIFIPKEKSKGAVTGHKVIVELTSYPDGRKSAEGEVIDILGHKNDPGVDILSIIHKHGLKLEFSKEALNQATETPESISESDIEGRRDLRDETIVTIDGADAKDLDDAVRVEKLPNGNFLLGVYIADVSYYIDEHSPMDEEAFTRGTSVYLVDRVIPMIPHRLSNGICSLNRGEDRLTIGCEMEINEFGQTVNYEIFESVIRTTERMTYENVNKILVDDDEAVKEEFKELVPMFKNMEQLAMILREKRMGRGAIDFNFKEAQVLVDDKGKPTDVILRSREIGERLIEEFMLAANETVAEHFHWLEVPFIHRIHEYPDEGKLEHFFEFLAGLGYIVRGTVADVHPLELQKVLKQIEGKKEELVVSKLMLRSMKQAKYDPASIGHFGLATDFYTHFTSPIRRYPDLMVHRLIRTYLLKGDLAPKTIAKFRDELPEIAKHTSVMERVAVETEREVDDLKKAEYMEDKIGEQFTGIISSVTNFGLFVELENTVEGLIHVSHMTDDYYHYNERHQALIGERTGKVYRIGEEVQIQVINVNIDERAVDFELING